MAKFSATEKKYIIECIKEIMETKYNHLRETFSDPDGYFKKCMYHGVNYTDAYKQALHDAVTQKTYQVTVSDSNGLRVTVPHLDKAKNDFLTAYAKVCNRYETMEKEAIHTVMLGNNLEEAKDILVTLQKL
jgi:hypothetical protein